MTTSLNTVSTLCVVPARGGSKRLKRKNVRELAGKPLLAYTVEAALQSSVFSDVIVSTEDDEIAAIAEDYGATVPFTRPAELASDTAQVVDVLNHVIEYYDERGDTYPELGVLFPTAPLRTAEDIQRAYEKFSAHDDAKFLMSVTDYHHTPVQALAEKDGYLTPFWEDQEVLASRSQDQPDLVISNGALYFMATDAYRKQRTFYGEPLIGYQMPRERSVDIDVEFDLRLAEFLLQQS